MSITEIVILAVGLSMDAFAASICIGLTSAQYSVKASITAGFYFGLFQALMPTLGYVLAMRFADSISAYDHWIAFFMLLIIGGKMLKESFEKGEPNNNYPELNAVKMLSLAIATSIDALAVGVSLAFLKVNIVASAAIIGITTFVISAAGVELGGLLGYKYKSKAETAGGVILILIGTKILLEHTGYI